MTKVECVYGMSFDRETDEMLGRCEKCGGHGCDPKVKAQRDEARRMVRELGQQIGFGSVMHLASEIWGEETEPKGHQHTVGPCAALTVSCPHPFNDGIATGCDVCEGCGLITKWVADKIAEKPKRFVVQLQGSGPAKAFETLEQAKGWIGDQWASVVMLEDG